MDKYLVKNANINIGLELLMNSEKSKPNTRVVIGDDSNKDSSNGFNLEHSLEIFKSKLVDRIEKYHPFHKKEDVVDYYIDAIWYKILFESIDSETLKLIYSQIDKTKK
jgi:hypothetical protein